MLAASVVAGCGAGRGGRLVSLFQRFDMRSIAGMQWMKC
jgi:hypothetical protein